MIKVVLISQFPLPFSGIGSWTTLYANYLAEANEIDYVVCAEPASKFPNVHYSIVTESLGNKIVKRFRGKNYNEYLSAIGSILQKGEKYVFQIVDNKGFALHLDAFLTKRKLRDRCQIQYFHHGFSPLYDTQKAGEFFAAIDELVLLTNASYQFYRQYYTNLPVRVSILHNGIDSAKFYKPTRIEKANFQSELSLKADKVFMWCSQDRPKKGLDIVLEAWKRVYSADKKMVLLVIGTDRKGVIDGVKFIGKIPNAELPRYYQAADIYLFPTLCQEGFGMTLIEALHCGCYCIASSAGGVPEVLDNGRFGVLIENPHFVSDWAAAINNALSDLTVFEIPQNLYSATSWNSGMTQLISDAKSVLTDRNGR